MIWKYFKQTTSLTGHARFQNNAAKHKIMNNNNPTTGQTKNHHPEHNDLIKERIRSLSDDELEALAAHAGFYQRRSNLRQTAGLLLVHDALLSLCHREQSPRPEDLSSPMAFKFFLKRVIRSRIDAGQPDVKPEPIQLDASRTISRKERKEYRSRLMNACRQLGKAVPGIPVTNKPSLSGELLKPLPGGLTPRRSCQPAGSLLLTGAGRSPLADQVLA